MKTILQSCNRFAVLLLLFCLPALAWADNIQEFSKKVERDFPISATGNVEIKNSYGVVDIKTWAENRVKITVTIEVDAKNDSEAQEFFNRVGISFSNNNLQVSATTNIESNKKWWSWLVGGNSDDEFSINYTILLPATVTLDLDNKFGDIYVSEMQNDMDVALQYGNLRLDGTTKNLDLLMQYSKGSLTNAENVDLDISYSSLRIGTTTNLDVTSRYSRLEINEAENIDSESKYDNIRISSAGSFENYGRYDDIFIETVASIEIETKFTNILLENVLTEVDAKLSYGGMTIKNLQQGFDNIEIESSYAPIKIDLGQSAQASYEIFSKYANVNLRNNVESFRQVEMATAEYKGYFGNNRASNTIAINMEYGSLVIE